MVKDRMRITMRAWPGIASIAGRSTDSQHSVHQGEYAGIDSYGQRREP
ncbi:hypothetical protein ABIF64_002468 [Bradyrhizobium japonicum]